jgi:uncharacterized Zn-binding protein involved in type VI secretion
VPPAARVGDIISDGGAVGVPTEVSRVLIGGKPAAVVGTVVLCDVHSEELGPANVLLPFPASMTVLIGGIPVACQGSRAVCEATVVLGATNVLIGGE